ncbi:unnamed protein product [Cylindrotheca closterium]|uniref:Uncharacterized protein n=1 Tax=Cylindrotheca closterium TaxID=2856 RepID=A0AAD2FNX9_9STRA|nr:unnamed protein product [Cylindrotheca closterium]
MKFQGEVILILICAVVVFFNSIFLFRSNDYPCKEPEKYTALGNPHQLLNNKRGPRILVGISAANFQKDTQTFHDAVRKFHQRFSSEPSARNSNKEWCSLYDVMIAGETFDSDSHCHCTLVYTFLVPTHSGASKPTNQISINQIEVANTLYLETTDVSLMEKWMEWASGIQVGKFDYVGFSSLESLDEESIVWLKEEVLKKNQDSTIAATKASNQQDCISNHCMEFGFLCFSMDLVEILKVRSFSPATRNAELSGISRLFRSLTEGRSQLMSTQDFKIKSPSKETEMSLSKLFKIQEVSDTQLDLPVKTSRLAPGLSPVTAIFMNGYLHDPSYLWAFSFPRVLLKHMSIHSSNTSRLRILGHEARTEKLWRINPLLNDDSTDNTTDLVEVLEGGKEVQNQMDIIFARNIAIPGLVLNHPDLFEFCEYHRKPRKHRNRKLPKTTNHSTCPVIVSFPIGTKPCDHCSPEWHLEIPDDQHVKTLSNSHWESISLIQKHLPATGVVPVELPNELLSLFDPSRWKFITSKGCTVAYVSRWNERKGQNRMTKEFLEYSKAGLLNNISSTTICFAGTAEGYEKQKEGIIRQLNAKFETIRAVDLGFLSFAEQILVFRLAGKSMLWTDYDQSPRIASLSLASGARVLTTELAQVPSPIVDDDCMVTVLHLFDNHTNSLEGRASIVTDFLSKEERCVKENETLTRAYPILQEDSFYGPIIERAMSMWTQLNANKERHCIKLFSHVCELFGMLRKVKKEGNCSAS